MDFGLKDKVAVVGASSKGLGKAIALGLAEEGAKVTICARDAGTLEATAAEIHEKTGVEVVAVPTDVSQPDQVKALIDRAVDCFGGIDILVNNAGGPRAGRFADLSPEDYQNALDLNLLSTINLCRAVVPGMKARGGGRIINLTSVSVKQPVDGLMLSNMARTGVIGFAKTLAFELAADNILVNSVCPGIIFTDRIKQLATVRAEENAITFDEAIANMTKDIPLGRIGDPQEFANLVVFLASERASYITGTTIQVDGGLVKGLL
jgi:3-oxoacyl-[acyl-carrier protein] reductase